MWIGVTVAADRPEAELLLWCARVCREPERAARLEELLQEEIDWAYVLRMASEHGVTPLLFWHLNATSPEAVPAAVLDDLQAYFRDNTHRNLLMTGELLEVVGLLEEHEILAVPYKGPTLATLAYGDLALREFGDLDILIHGWDVPRAKELLGSLGYRPRYPLTPAQEAVFLDAWGEYMFIRDGGSRAAELLELHWPVAKRPYLFRLYPEDIWERLQHVSLGGGVVPTLAPEDLLLVLCVHGSKHSWVRLNWICDVAKLVHARGDEIGWERLAEQAASLGSERMLLLGLLLANDLLGAALPQKVLQKIQADSTVKTLAGQVRESLFDEATGVRGSLAGKRFRSFHLKVRKRLRDKIQYCLHSTLMPNEQDCKLFELPESLWPLYYVARPIRLTNKFGRRLLRSRPS